MRRLSALALAALLALPVAALALPAPAPVASLPAAPAGAQAVQTPWAVVTIHYDAFAVPHVTAPDQASLWYANGYVQAHDRLFAMDVLRHVGRGQAASILGPSLLGSDLTARQELYTEAQRLAKFQAMAPEAQAVLQHYADGVNRAMAEMAAQGNLPAEFPALNHAPEPWTVLDSVAIIDFLLDRFGTGGGGEVGNAKLLAQLEKALPAAAVEGAFADALWVHHPTSYATLPGTFQGPAQTRKAFQDIPQAQWQAARAAMRAEPFGQGEELLAKLQDAAGLDAVEQGWPFPIHAIGPADLKWGSNALAIAPSLSRTGQALLGGGPQMGYFNPQVPWEVGLHAPGYDAVGIGVTGAPGLVIGRTEDFAWTVTSGASDQTDLVALRAAGVESYLWDGEVRDLECRTEVHVVANPPALGPMAPEVLTQRVCESHVGPVLHVAFEGDGDPEFYFAARKAHRGLELEGARQWLSVAHAESLEEFRAAFEGFPFTFNFHYAGPEGACYHHVGVLPVRNAALDPRLPSPGGSAWAWQGQLTGADLPRGCNPLQGFYANWNNLPQRGWSSGDGREMWGSTHRVDRLVQETVEAVLASPDGKLGIGEVRSILKEAATHDSLARPLVLAMLPHAPQGAADALRAWLGDDLPWADADRDGVYDHLGHAWYDRVRQDLQGLVLGDELGPHLRAWNPNPLTSSDPHAADHGRHDNKDALLFDALRGATDHAWCDDVRTLVVESCAQHVQAAFAAAVSVDALDVHLSPFTAIGAGPAYRIPMTNRATYYHFHVGPDTAHSGSAMPPGQSGHLAAPELAAIVLLSSPGPLHMSDQLALYNHFQLKVVPTTPAEIGAVAQAQRTLLVPSPPGVPVAP
jgi:penicillin G amidase